MPSRKKKNKRKKNSKKNVHESYKQKSTTPDNIYCPTSTPEKKPAPGPTLGINTWTGDTWNNEDSQVKIVELSNLLSVDLTTARKYYVDNKGDFASAMKQYFLRTGRRPTDDPKSNTKEEREEIKAPMLNSPRLLNRPSQLNLFGEDGSDAMPMTISFRVKSAVQENDEAAEGYSSDSSGVGLITPRHEHRPAPLFDLGDLGDGNSGLRSCSSRSDMEKHRDQSFRSGAHKHTPTNATDLLDEIDQYVDEFGSDSSADSSDHSHGDIDDDEEGYSSDSSGVGLITPRHQHRPPPLFNEHHSDDEGVDPMPSVKSKACMNINPNPFSTRATTSSSTSSTSSTSSSSSSSTSSTTATATGSSSSSTHAMHKALVVAEEEIRQLSNMVTTQSDIIDQADEDKQILLKQLAALQMENDELKTYVAKQEEMEELTEQVLESVSNELTQQQQKNQKLQQEQEEHNEEMKFILDEYKHFKMSSFNNTQLLSNKCQEYESILLAQSSQQESQMDMIRELRRKNKEQTTNNKLLIGQVTYERNMRLRPSSQNKEQAMLKQRLRKQRQMVTAYKQNNVVETSRRRQERAWEERDD